MSYLQLLLLGAIAGFTIFLGLPLAFWKGAGRRTRAFLNAFSAGILTFLLVEVAHKVIGAYPKKRLEAELEPALA